MSDWIDLQLAHSLGRVKAPDELWARIQRRPVRRASHAILRWGTVAAVAAGVTVLLARPVRESQVEIATARPAVVQRSLAHEATVRVVKMEGTRRLRNDA